MDAPGAVAALASKEERKRELAANWLRRSDPDVTGPALLAALSSPYGFVVRQALELLAEIAPPGATDRLEAFAAEDSRFELVWLSRQALRSVRGERDPAPVGTHERTRAYGAELVVEALLWRNDRVELPGREEPDGVVLALMPSFHAEAVLLVTEAGIDVCLASSSVWEQANLDRGLWPSGGFTARITDEASMIEYLRSIAAAWPSTTGVAADGLVVGGFAFDDGRRTELAETQAVGDVGQGIRRVAQHAMETARDEPVYAYFRDLGSYFGASLSIVRTDRPLRALAALGHCRDDDWPTLSDAIVGHRPLVLDLTQLSFLAPSLAPVLAKTCSEFDIHLVGRSDNPYHQVPDLGRRLHDSWDDALAATETDIEPLDLIGYWANGDGSDRYPHPGSLVGNAVDRGRQEEIAGFLDDGLPVAYAMGLSPCRICDRPNGAAELTDGRFIWPEGLAHYVRDHNVVLPTAITDQLRARPSIEDGRWLIPSIACDVASSDEHWLELTRR